MLRDKTVNQLSFAYHMLEHVLEDLYNINEAVGGMDKLIQQAAGEQEKINKELDRRER